jgi:type I restriction enzyme S subunit
MSDTVGLLNGEWRKKPLKNVVQLEKNSWKVGQEPQPYIALEHIVEGGLRLQGIGDSATIASNKYRFNPNTFLFGKLRPYFRKLFRPDFSGICSTDIWVVKPKEGNDKDFLFYFFANQEFIDLSYSGSSGTRMPRADWKFVSEQKWEFPPLPEQKAIAEVLSSLDDKIDLLHRQNKTLEQMAETLFRQWFVEEAGEDWEEKPLSDCVDVAIGRTPPRKQKQWFSRSDRDIKWVSIKDMGDSGIFIFDTSEYLTAEAVDNFNIPVIPKNTVVLSFKMTLGRVGITSEEMLSNEAIAHFKFNNGTPFNKEYLFLFLKTYPYQILGSTSSIVTSINSRMIKELIIPIPDKQALLLFDEQVKDIFLKIKKNQKQIRTLESLRDTLLPKLMSGEIRVAI